MLDEEEKMILQFIDTTGVLRDKTLYKTYEKLDKTFNTIFSLLVPDGEAKDSVSKK